jgi:hypothetical protein
MQATFPSQLILFSLVTLVTLGRNLNYEAPHYIIFCTLLLLSLSCSTLLSGLTHQQSTTLLRVRDKLSH